MISGRARVLLLGLLTVVALGGAAELRAQAATIAAVQLERDLEYRSAQNAHEAALAARAAVQTRFTVATDEVTRARESGDRTRLDAALAEAQRIAFEMQSADLRISETGDALERARRAFVDVVDARMELIAEEIRYAPGGVGREPLQAMYADLSIRLGELEAADRSGIEVRAVMIPEISVDVRDGPVELLAKAEMLEDRAIRYDSLIVVVDNDLEELQRRLRREQGLNVLLSGIERFDDARVPVGSTQSQSGTAADGAGNGQQATDGEPLSLEARIESLRVLRGLYEDYRAEARRRASQFRGMAEGVEE